MPHVTQLPEGTRFFARLERFVCECPVCGSLILAHLRPGQERGTSRIKRLSFRRGRWAKHWEVAAPFNPVTGQLRCPECQRLFGVGLILWPFGKYDEKGIPGDWRSGTRLKAQMRQYTIGHWSHLPAAAEHGTNEQNLALDVECCCPVEVGAIAMACPVHGWPATQGALYNQPPDPEQERRLVEIAEFVGKL